MERYFLLGFLGSALALGFAALQRRRVLSVSEGNERMQKIAAAIRAGANAYLKHQYTTVFKVFAIVFLLLLVLAFASGGQMLSRVTPFAFLTGGIFSMLAGFIGMRIATSANARTANAARESLNKGLKVAFSSGSVMGFSVVGLGMLDVTLWFFLLRYGLGYAEPEKIGSVMVMNGMGASFMALFARVGGGIYTKAADVGADLVGKVEAGIPEDDPRNPATIADNVGDNVGDVAGMGADLYESYVGSILATFALGGIAGYGFRGMLLPLLLAVCGILCSILGSFLIRTKENASQEAPDRQLGRVYRHPQRPGGGLRDRLFYRVLHLGYLQAHPGACPGERDRQRYHHHRGPVPGHALHHGVDPGGGGGGAAELFCGRRGKIL